MACQKSQDRDRCIREAAKKWGRSALASPFNVDTSPIVATLPQLCEWLRIKDPCTLSRWHKKYGMPLHKSVGHKYIAFIPEIRIWLSHFNRIRREKAGAWSSDTEARKSASKEVARLIEETLRP